MTTNTHGYRYGEKCACGNSECTIILYPANVRVERTNPVTHEITNPLVSVDILMGLHCGRKYGPVA